MTTKEKILELFESNRDTYFSGEELAQKLSISRTAVWKAVKTLQNEGYAIDAVTNKGYCLSAKTDILSAQGITKYLRTEIKDMNISVMDIVDSTQELLCKISESIFINRKSDFQKKYHDGTEDCCSSGKISIRI